MIRRLFIALLAACSSGIASAQDETKNFTVYKEFKPGVIYMANGKKLKNPLLNIFMKNASLLYKSGTLTKEALMDNIVGVDFDDRKYINVQGELCYVIDSVGNNKLYCATLVDLEAYKAMQRNNVNISHLSIADQVSYTTVELEPQEGIQMPVINHFYYLYNGQIIKVHERELYRLLPKEKRRIYKTIISENNFSWVDPDSLVRLLKAIS